MNPAQAQILNPAPINTQPAATQATTPPNAATTAQPNNGLVNPERFEERFGVPAGREPIPGVPSTVDRNPGGSPTSNDDTTTSGTAATSSGEQDIAAGQAAQNATRQNSTPVQNGTATQNGTAAQNGTATQNGTASQNGTATQNAPSAQSGTAAQNGTASNPAQSTSRFQTESDRRAAERLNRARLAERFRARRADGTSAVPATTAAESLNNPGANSAAAVSGTTATPSTTQPSSVRADGSELFEGAATRERRDPSVIPNGQIANTPATGSNTQNIDNTNSAVDPATGQSSSTATGSNTQNLGDGTAAARARAATQASQGDGVFTPAQSSTRNQTGAGTPSGAAQLEGLRQRNDAAKALRAQGQTGFNTERAATQQAVRNGQFADDRATANRNATGGFNLQRDFGLNLAAAANDGFQGLAVSQVAQGGIAESLGLTTGDRLVSVNGVRLGSPQNLIGLLGNPNLANDVFIRVQRGDQFFSVRVSPQQLLNNLGGNGAGVTPATGTTGTSRTSINDFR